VRGRWHWTVAVVAWGALLGTFTGVVADFAAATPVLAVRGLDTSATATYSVDFAAGLVRGEIEFGFVNSAADRQVGERIEQTYFKGFEFGLPEDAVNIAAVTAGRPLAVTLRPSDNNFQMVTVGFDANLEYGQRLDITVTFDLTGYAPRRAEPLRASGAFVSFVAWAYGDPGGATVRIVTPSVADVSIPALDSGSSLRPQIETMGRATVRTFHALANPQRFSLFVTAANDRQLVDRRLRIGGTDVVVQAWPDDRRWGAFIARQVRRGLPALEQLIGRALPDRPTLYVRESAEPGLEGYSGWFHYDTGVVELGEELDPIVATHELSHGWFDDDTSYHRWVTEGLAETYANAVVRRSGGNPRRAERPAPSAPGRQPLNDWEDFGFSLQNQQTETYGYTASYFVVASLFREIGPARMSDVLAAIDAATPAYRLGGRIPKGPVGWRRLLDLLEQVGGSQQATRLFRRYVVTDVEAADVDARSVARAGYDELVERADGWAPPSGVDHDMELWEFDRAEDLMVAAQEVVAERDSFVNAAAGVGMELPRTFETRFEQATNVDALELIAEDIADLQDALGVVSAADAEASADRSSLESLALGDETFASDLAEARDAIGADEPDVAEALAGQVRSTLAVAESVGRQRANALADTGLGRLRDVALAAGAGLVFSGLVALVAMLVRRRRWRRAALRDVAAHLDAGGDAPVDGDVEVGVGARLELDEDALAGTGLGRMDRGLDVAAGDGGERTGATRVVEGQSALGDVGDPVLELGEDVGAMVDAQPVARAEVLVDPDAHVGTER
jgi:hypothetical protein